MLFAFHNCCTHLPTPLSMPRAKSVHSFIRAVSQALSRSANVGIVSALYALVLFFRPSGSCPSHAHDIPKRCRGKFRLAPQFPHPENEIFVPSGVQQTTVVVLFAYSFLSVCVLLLLLLFCFFLVFVRP